jgi:peptidyl-prolyl cis-trans isomerase-like protein 2
MNAIGGAATQLRQLAKGKEKAMVDDNAANDPKSAPSKDDPPPLPKTTDATPYNAAAYSTGRSAASLTSTSADIATKSERALVDEEEYMYERIKDKSYGASSPMRTGSIAY